MLCPMSDQHPGGQFPPQNPGQSNPGQPTQPGPWGQQPDQYGGQYGGGQYGGGPYRGGPYSGGSSSGGPYAGQLTGPGGHAKPAGAPRTALIPLAVGLMLIARTGFPPL